MKTKEKKIIKDAIIHLNGYCLLVEKATGYNAVALRDIIKQLKRMIE